MVSVYILCHLTVTIHLILHIIHTNNYVVIFINHIILLIMSTNLSVLLSIVQLKKELFVQCKCFNNEIY